jgi:hypothetical protein
VESDDAILDGRLFGQFTDAGGSATVRMTMKDGFTVWQLSLPEVRAENVAERSGDVEARDHPAEAPTGQTPKRLERAYRGPILKPSEADRQRRHERGAPENGDDSWVPCPRCAESQDPRGRRRCEVCEGRGMVPYWTAADY